MESPYPQPTVASPTIVYTPYPRPPPPAPEPITRYCCCWDNILAAKIVAVVVAIEAWFVLFYGLYELTEDSYYDEDYIYKYAYVVNSCLIYPLVNAAYIYLIFAGISKRKPKYLECAIIVAIVVGVVLEVNFFLWGARDGVEYGLLNAAIASPITICLAVWFYFIVKGARLEVIELISMADTSPVVAYYPAPMVFTPEPTQTPPAVVYLEQPTATQPAAVPQASAHHA